MLPVGGCARCGARSSCLTGPGGADGSAAGFSRFYPEIIGGAGLLGFLLPGFFGGLRSGHIDDDFRDFVAGLGNTAEEEVANISHDSGAARGNAILETRMRRRESTSLTSPA